MSQARTSAPITGWRRWGAYLALTVVFAVACGLLSWWQWARRAEAVDTIQRVERNYDAPPQPLADILTSRDAWHVDDEWRPVSVHGVYLADEALLVRNRVRGGKPGFEQLVPLRLDDGRVFIVNRGWLPIGESEDLPDEVPAPPTGEISVIARLRPAEPVLPGRTAPPGQIPSIAVASILDDLGTPGFTGAYGLLVSENPPGADLPFPSIKPEADEGPHLSYALQWIAFGVLAFFGLFWAWRREKRIAALPAEEQAAARAPKRRHVDADVEDAILDRRPTS